LNGQWIVKRLNSVLSLEMDDNYWLTPKT
jgi:hypothetical protein